MPRLKSKTIDNSWADLLAEQLASAKPPEGGRKMVDIANMLKDAGLPAGRSQCQVFVRRQKAEGKLKQFEVFERINGRAVRQVYYVPLK